MKRVTKIIAVAALLGGLTAVAGCANNTPDARVATSANWNVRTSTKVENDSLEFWAANKEVATYTIKHVPLSKGNQTYSVSYAEGDDAYYTTELYVEDYDWRDGKIPEGWAGEQTLPATEKVYVFETHMYVKGTYTVKGYDGRYLKNFTDTIDSVCKYRLAGNNLQPVYSLQKVKNTAPNTLSAKVVPGLSVDEVMDGVCVAVDADYETYYKRDFTEAKVITTSRNKAVESGEAVVQLGSKEGYSVFDTTQIKAAIRAFALTGSVSRTFNVMVPQAGAVQNCTVSSTPQINLTATETEQAQIIKALRDSTDYIYFDGTTADNQSRTPRFNAVSLGLNASLKGQTPMLWYASVENEALNTTRGVLVRMIEQLPFSLGTLSYSLKSIEVKPVNL